MPYLSTSQTYLEQSALLLQAYPDSRISTKYHFPNTRPAAHKKAQQSRARKSRQRTAQPSSTDTAAENDPSSQQPQQPAQSTQQPAQSTTSTPIATLILKTYSPAAGITLKYRTNKAAEVGRLITNLGKLAGGADVAALGLSASGVAEGATGAGADVEMMDAPAGEDASATATAGQAAAGGKDTGAGEKGGKGKKKGKGKR